MTRGRNTVAATMTLTMNEDAREKKTPARPRKTRKLRATMAIGILSTAYSAVRNVDKSARREAMTAASRTGAIPKARVQKMIVAMYSGSKANERLGTSTGIRNKKPMQMTTLTRPDTVIPTFTRVVLSSDSGM